MNRKARVFNNAVLAGILEEDEAQFRFTYDSAYLGDHQAHAISRTMPKRERPYESQHLFAFFHGLLAEGVAKDLQCRLLRLDERDYFGRLLKTANTDPIGSITVEEASE